MKPKFKKMLGSTRSVFNLRAPMLKYSTILFTIGMLLDLLLYVREGKILLLLVNGICILAIPFIWIFYRTGRLTINKALVLHVWSVVINLYISMFSEIVYSSTDAAKNIMLIMLICMIPTIYAGITTIGFMPLLISICTLICYTVMSVYLNDVMMLQSLPVLVLVYVGGALALWHLVNALRVIERQNTKVHHQEQHLIRFFNMTPDAWEMIKEGKLSEEESEKILSELGKKSKYKLMSRLKNAVQDEVEIKDILRKNYPALTSGELQLCYYILDGLSVMEISQIRNVGVSTITSMRSRLRTKLNLLPGDNLKDFLESFIRKEIK